MKKILQLSLALLLFAVNGVYAQTPVAMASRPGLTYTEDFSDINNWVFSTAPTNGTFIAGIGASAWKGNSAGGSSSGAIPSPRNISTATTSFSSMSSGGVHRENQSLVLLSTGTTDNTTSATMDFFLNFTGVNAGTISFDWATINNSTGNRNGSIRVYAAVDALNFTEITALQVLNVTNNVPANGSKINVQLPAMFNNNANAQLRFYYHNGVGGTTGSRPKISIDNIKVTALSTSPCVEPPSQPSSFQLAMATDVSLQVSFVGATPTPDNYLVVMSTNSTLSANPANGVTYAAGASLGGGTVIQYNPNTFFTVSSLTPATTYYFFIFSANDLCQGGPTYNTVTPLSESAATLPGFVNCVTPSQQPTALVFSNITTKSLTGNFTAPSPAANEYLVVRSLSSSLGASPINGVVYNPGMALGNGTVISRGASLSFNSTGLSPATTYHYFVFALNSVNCNNGPAYNTTSPLTNNASTNPLAPCTTPTNQPTGLNLSASNTYISGDFVNASGADSYLVLYSTSTTLSMLPVNGNTYAAGTTLGNATVATNGASSSFIVVNLTPGTNYYFFVFAINADCSGGPNYLTTAPLTANTMTTTAPALNYYYGNLHSHSYYSDGNKDNPTFTPAHDFAYAKNSLCMDFLGISDHNHAGAGMSISNWQPGLNQAKAATTSNFLALYGMEWGVISGGGHVLVYGTDQLLGWENGNYNTFVPKSDYIGTPSTTGTTGLFRQINQLGTRAFATLAHPSFSDFNNIANMARNLTADSAIVGTTLESGPAFSTSTNYNDPAFSFGYLEYFRTMLARGYRLGPTVDHDNHNTTFGRTTNSRLAVMAPTLDSNGFFNAMKAMNFYATQDCDTRVIFSLNNQIMGSEFKGTKFPSMNIYAFDPTSPSAVPSIRIFSGVPGTAILPVEIASSTGTTFTFTDLNLPNLSTAYYYADIMIDGRRTITSPIWYTRDSLNTLPVTLLEFAAKATSQQTVALSWKTANELNNDKFIVERSANGLNFNPIGTVAGKNNSNISTYSFIDATPISGLNYYRLKQLDKDGKSNLSKVVAVNLAKSGINAVSVYPNPVVSVLQLNISAAESGNATVLITDMFGRNISSYALQLNKGQQQISLNTNMAPGTYFATVHFSNEKVTTRFVKL